MDKKTKITGVSLGVLVLLGVVAWYLHRTSIPVLEPKGPIAAQELHLLIIATLAMLIVVVPVFVMTGYIVWKYRADKKSVYKPNWDGNRLAETTWWIIPSLLIIFLSAIAWRGSYQLDPYKPLGPVAATLNVQVVALDWRWLFIYPEQHIASLNSVVFPKGQPVHFYITADAPMNSFWIPQLSGQMYAMPGMQTQLNLSASSYGTFVGRSANISGKGFAGMQFTARATTMTDFNTWVATAQRASKHLTMANYMQLARPSQNNQVALYSRPANDLFSSIMQQYAGPDGSAMAGMNMTANSSSDTMTGMEMMR